MLRTDRRCVRDQVFAARPAVAPCPSLFLSSSFSAKKSSEDPTKPARWPIGVHHLRELHQANRSRELWIFHSRRHTPCGLRMRQIGRNFENVRGEMIDSVEKTAATGDKNAGAEIAEIWLFFESSLEQLKGFAQPQVDNSVQRFALDLFPRKT